MYRDNASYRENDRAGMNNFCAQMEHYGPFLITTPRCTFESLYLIVPFANWSIAYNQCFKSLLTDEEEAAIAKIVCDQELLFCTERWIPAFCKVVDPSIGQLAHDMSESTCDESVSLQKLARNMSMDFDAFCSSCWTKRDPDETESGKGTDVPLTIDHIEDIGRDRVKKEEKEATRKNLQEVLCYLAISDITFWFMLYFVCHMKGDALFRTLEFLKRGTGYILDEETTRALQHWKEGQKKSGSMDLNAMVFIIMY